MKRATQQRLDAINAARSMPEPMKPKQYDSLVLQLEDTVLSLEAQGQTEQDIFSMVHMIMRGFIRGGQLTPEYIALANEALKIREEEAQGIVRIDTPNLGK